LGGGNDVGGNLVVDCHGGCFFDDDEDLFLDVAVGLALADQVAVVLVALVAVVDYRCDDNDDGIL
jgi:hypothetical protein